MRVLLLIILSYPQDFLTVKTPNILTHGQISLMDAGYKLGNFYFSVSPIYLTVFLNLGISYSKGNLILGGHMGYFYGEYLLKSLDSNIESIDVKADGFNLYLGYKIKSVVLNVKAKIYGDYRAIHFQTGTFYKPLILEAGVEVPFKFTFGAGIYLEKQSYFLKMGITGPGVHDLGVNLPVLPYVNLGVKF